MSKSYLACQGLSYRLPNHELLFENVSLEVTQGAKTALIGNNGVGKSTLFKILNRELDSSSGALSSMAKTAIVWQNSQDISGRIDDVLGIREKLEAIEAVSAGNVSAENLEIIGNDWDIENRARKELSAWQMDYLDWKQQADYLSGGEKQKLSIMRALLSGADILLFDEPTNNLDLFSKQKLWEHLLALEQGVLIITHDRMILNQVDEIFEMTANGINRYGGNYDFYVEQKRLSRQKLEEHSVNLNKEVNRLSQQQQADEQKQSRQKQYGEKSIANRRYSKMVGNAMKMTAQETQARKQKQTAIKIDEFQSEIYDLGLKLKEDIIKISLPDKPFIREKLLELRNVNFSYGERKLIKDFNLLMKGNDRIALCGCNGCGKTTLLQLIYGRLQPNEGMVKLNGQAVYLNQDLNLLNKNLPVIESVMLFNPGCSLNEAHKTLANFQFRNVDAYKQTGILSGGELLKASLAAVFCTQKQPDILILDEPTNNLDIQSVEILEAALAQYQGAIVVVSHDEIFLEHIKIKQKVYL